MGKWGKTGRIEECLPNHQYKFHVERSGRITLRNRRFIKELRNKATEKLIPSLMMTHTPAEPTTSLSEGDDRYSLNNAEPDVANRKVMMRYT